MIDRSFLEFTAAVITLVHKRGYCDYNELFPAQPSGANRKYACSSGRILGQLSKSKFPRAMMATAICELVPLNLITRGGRGSSSVVEMTWRAKKAARDASNPLIEKLVARMRSDHYSEEDISIARKDFAVMEPGEAREFARHFLKNEEGNGASEPSFSWKRGTPAHQVNYIGASRLSRAMASYWRNHKEYRSCRSFLRGLLPLVIPTERYHERIVHVDKQLNANFTEYLRRRRVQQSLGVG